MNTLYLIVLISVAGPVIGSAIGVIRQSSLLYVCNMLSFAAGVMLAISFLELIPESLKLSSVWVCAAGVILGSLVMLGLDRLIPHVHPGLSSQEQGRHLSLERTSAYLIAGIFIHNLPEGMAIGIGGAASEKLSLAIALAISIHNIPEGICTSAPYFLSTNKRWKAFLISSSTAIPILAGFLLSHFLLHEISPTALGLIMSATAGLMIYISADELIPASCRAPESHSTIFSLMAGVLFVILLKGI